MGLGGISLNDCKGRKQLHETAAASSEAMWRKPGSAGLSLVSH